MILAERCAFSGALNFDKTATAIHHNIHIGLGAAILIVIQVQHWGALINPYRNGRYLADYGGFTEDIFIQQCLNGVIHGDESARYRSRAGAAIRLDDIAIQRQGALAQFFHIDAGAQRAAYQALNFHRAAALFSAACFAPHTAGRGAWQHAVFSGYPATAFTAQKAGNPLFHAGVAQYFGITAFDQHRTFGMFGVMPGNLYLSELVSLSATGSHRCSPDENARDYTRFVLIFRVLTGCVACLNKVECRNSIRGFTMLKSMTAFSRVQQSNDSGDIVWELKSVNHRYLEPGFRLPDDFKLLEPDIRQRLGRYVKRGKIDISLRYKLNSDVDTAIQLNAQMVKQLRKVEQQVLTIVHGGHSMSVSDILCWPGVVNEPGKDFNPLQELALSCLDEALGQLVENRQREGQALHDMIATRCGQVVEIIKQVQQRRPQVLEAMQKKWSSQLNEKLASWSEATDSGRLEQELVMLAQKIDVEEELDRLMAHVNEVEKVLKRDEAIGRRLDFLMQELNREANTLSSKSQDVETTRLAVDLKVLIEQMREQVQNIE